MNAKQLRDWKHEEEARCQKLYVSHVACENVSIVDFHPEIDVCESFSTTTEPWVPVWASLPFFERVLVNINYTICSEDEFQRFYGITSSQLWDLHARGRVAIRLIYPRSRSTLPTFMNQFYHGHRFSTSLNAFQYVLYRLGEEEVGQAKEQFWISVGSHTTQRAMDSSITSSARALHTAEAVFLMLKSLGRDQELARFQRLATSDFFQALQWLRTCGAILSNRVFYSLGAIHSVAGDSIVGETPNLSRSSFPTDLGLVLAEVLELVRPVAVPDRIRLGDCLAVYDNSELARKTLLELATKIERGSLGAGDVDAIRSIVREARGYEAFFLKALRVISAVTGSAVSSVLPPGTGILSSLGLSVAQESASKRIENAGRSSLEDLLTRVGKGHLALVLQLDRDVRRRFDVTKG